MLRITIYSVGKKHDSHFASAIAAYEQKLLPYAKVAWQLLPNSDKDQESQAILQKTEGSYRVLLDNGGEQYSSEDIANTLDKWQTTAQNDIALIIGGAYGVNDELRAASDLVVSFGPLTFPHQLVRVMVLEQLYRGFSILKGTGYHHQ
jgi:23S rRNA (pseudouridine1915-N3)-methyltransferase